MIGVVSNSKKNNGVVLYIKQNDKFKICPAGTISVTAKLNTLTAFYHLEPYYTTGNVFCLQPRQPLSFKEVFYYLTVIELNKWRYPTSRTADYEFLDMLIPAPNSIPQWVKDFNYISLIDHGKKEKAKAKVINTEGWTKVKIGDLFNLEKGKVSISKLTLGGNTPLVTNTVLNNGVNGCLDQGKRLLKGGSISIRCHGTTAMMSFYQPNDFYATDTVIVASLKSGKRLTLKQGLLVCALLELQAFRFNFYSKLVVNKLKNLNILLPLKGGEISPPADLFTNCVMSQ